jgi:Uma2 family endonuclease
MNSPTLTWEAICADRSLRDLPYKIETNRYNQIILSPASGWHGHCEYEIGKLLEQRLPGGKIIQECPVQTVDGIRVADVAWMSLQRWQPVRRSVAFPVAPEVCVEILSPSNSREEMLEKMQLYFAKGAQEVWLCDEDGRFEFFTAVSAPHALPHSQLCPDFPQSIKLD